MVSLCKLYNVLFGMIDYCSLFGRTNHWASWLWPSWGSNPQPFDHESDALASQCATHARFPLLTQQQREYTQDIKMSHDAC